MVSWERLGRRGWERVKSPLVNSCYPESGIGRRCGRNVLTKALKKVAFFIWCAIKDTIFTANNL